MDAAWYQLQANEGNDIHVNAEIELRSPCIPPVNTQPRGSRIERLCGNERGEDLGWKRFHRRNGKSFHPLDLSNDFKTSKHAQKFVKQLAAFFVVVVAVVFLFVCCLFVCFFLF